MTTTTNLALTLLTSGQLQPEVTVNEDLNILDSVIGSLPAAFGNNPNTTTGLTYGYYGATLYRSGAPVTIANGTIGMTASATNYVQRTVQGVVSVNTTGYLTGNIPMATVVTGASAITTITDTRPAGYDLTGRVVVEVGAPTGLVLTTATTGGSIAASTDCTYRISAVYPWGESAASAEVSVTTGGSTATNENTLTWSALPAGALSANIYGRTAGGELKIANVLAATLTYTDTGSVTPAGALPAGTLTLTPEQYNFGIVSLQGALGGNTSVVFPTAAQQWLVSNDTSGAYPLLCTVSGGVGPTIPQGQARPIYANGTNLAEANTSPFGSDPLTTTGLTWGYFGGRVRNDNVVTTVTPGTIALTASATNYVQINPSNGAISVNTTGFASGQVPIAELVTSGTGILTYTDQRASILDGPGVSVAVANTWTAEQTFDATIAQTPGQGANNETPFLQAADLVSDYVVSGLLTPVPSTASLTGTLAAGTAYVLGQRTVLQAAVAYTYAASSDTYVDLSYSGVLTYSAVANGATAPAVAADSLRLEKVVTDAIVSPSPTLAASTAAGTLAAGTYEYQLVAHDATGYGLPSALVSITTTATGEVVLTWTNPLNETSMDIYGRVSGAIGLLASGVTGTTWTDTGAATVGAAPPTAATSNAIQGVTQLAPTQVSDYRQASFTANGSFTPTVPTIYVSGTAAGGGGSSSQGGQSAAGGGGGGGAGQSIQKTPLSVVIGHSLTISIGAAGTGGPAGASAVAGTNGGNTVITDSVTGAVLLTLGGGSGGQPGDLGAGGIGGAGYPQGDGGGSACYYASSSYGDNAGGKGGMGGATLFGAGGGGAPGTQVGATGTNGSPGGNAYGYGAGGGGAGGMSSNVADGQAGGNGSPGFVLIEW